MAGEWTGRHIGENTQTIYNRLDCAHLRLRLYYPGGQTQPEMQGVLGGQVRFNIRLRQVGAQATPPLCSLQLWYTFPSGHSPTSTLSGSADQKSILNRKSTATTCQSRETCGNCRRKGYWVRGLKRDFVVSVEVEGYPFPLARTPSCRFCRGWRGDGGRQQREIFQWLTRLIDLPNVSFDKHSRSYCFPQNMSDKLCVRMWPCVQFGSEFLIFRED